MKRMTSGGVHFALECAIFCSCHHVVYGQRSIFIRLVWGWQTSNIIFTNWCGGNGFYSCIRESIAHLGPNYSRLHDQNWLWGTFLKWASHLWWDLRNWFRVGQMLGNSRLPGRSQLQNCGIGSSGNWCIFSRRFFFFFLCLLDQLVKCALDDSSNVNSYQSVRISNSIATLESTLSMTEKRPIHCWGSFVSPKVVYLWIWVGYCIGQKLAM